MAINPQLAFLLNQAIQYLRVGNFQSAELFLKQAQKAFNNNAEVLRLLGVLEAQRGNDKQALAYLESALNHAPSNGIICSNLGNIYRAQKRYDEALKSYERAIMLEPSYAEAYSNKGNVLFELQRHEDALRSYEHAIRLEPKYAEAYCSKGHALVALHRYEEAIIACNASLDIWPEYAEAWAEKAIALKYLHRYEEALACYENALKIKPDYSGAWVGSGTTLYLLKSYDGAIACFDKAISLKPDFIEAWVNKAESLNKLRKHQLSAECYFKAIELGDKNNYCLGAWQHQKMLICDWSDYSEIKNRISEQVGLGMKCAEPFGLQGVANSEKTLQECARIYSHDKFPSDPISNENFNLSNQKIRIGYLCGEFRKQATSILLARIWELHDKSNFEIYAFDNGWNDGSEYRERIENSFTKIFDISKLSDQEASNLIKLNQIDILVNLNGFFGEGRQGVFANRSAPIQVNYLGFPGTLGANYMDYLIADRTVIPFSSQQYYDEKIVYLPNSYQANDDKRIISSKQFRRGELGLPEQGFVYCCFNNSYKITPTIFEYWMKILLGVDGSVLWLLEDSVEATKNLRAEAVRLGVDGNRLVFASRTPLEDHLARHSAADLFLDTLPYNAHTTASDALWAGVPVLTLTGTTFPGRVGASLLKAINLPELIAENADDYISMAVDLAHDSGKLKILTERLSLHKLNAPLFNAHLFAQYLEAAFLKMYSRAKEGLLPESFEIEKIS